MKQTTSLTRRGFLRRAGAALAASSAPMVWIPNPAFAQTSGRGRVKHLLYIRLSGGFRFPAAFNADVGDELNPFGRASGRAPGTEWGVGGLLARAPFLEGAAGQALRALGMRPVPEMANQISVVPCVDHEPLSASADGNHGTALERWYSGSVDGPVGFFTMIGYGLRDRMTPGQVSLPPFVLGGAGMGRGIGKYAAHRPPVLAGEGFDRFRVQGGSDLAPWARAMADRADAHMRDRQHPGLRGGIDAYIESRKATRAYGEIFASDALKIGSTSGPPVDGLTNRQLADMLGDGGGARGVRLALRLFHFGSPAVYLDEGGYDLHSGEEGSLPARMLNVNRLISGLEAALKALTHPAGGRYWDHTMVVMGSEFSRTTRGQKFNSARGSDHGGDLATRFMSMPFMGGAIPRPGRRLGETRASDLKAVGKVYSYRSVLKTLMDGLGCQHDEFFPADPPFDDLYA